MPTEPAQPGKLDYFHPRLRRHQASNAGLVPARSPQALRHLLLFPVQVVQRLGRSTTLAQGGNRGRLRRPHFRPRQVSQHLEWVHRASQPAVACRHACPHVSVETCHRVHRHQRTPGFIDDIQAYKEFYW